MRAASLLGVLVLAKVCVLAGRDLTVSAWTPIAYLWQDCLVVLLFGVLDAVLRRAWLGWTLYGVIVTYVAVNVPVARVLSTPLTWPLLRAARGPLADSITYYATWENLGLVLLIVTVAGVLPLLLRRVRPKVLAVAGALVIPPVVMLGPIATDRVETGGLHRNPLAALVTTALPRVPAISASADWRASPYPSPPADDLTQFRGAAAGRNVVVISLESTGARYLRTYGAAEDPMANVSRLSEQAIVFEDGYAVYPESIKGLFSVVCSTYPAIDTTPEAYAGIGTPSLAAVLNGAGYRTGLFHSGRFGYLGMESIVQNRGYHTLEDAGAIGGDYNSSFGVDEPSTVRRILSWVDGLPQGQRFFVTYLPIAGHHPYFTPERGPFPERDDIGRYRNALHYADAAVGQLLDGLRGRGLDRNTLFVVFGDHGEAFGQHEGNFGHTLSIYDENVRVPYLIAAPGLIDKPTRVRRVASLIDTAPTILDLLGLPAPRGYQGVSLLDSESGMALFFTDYSLGYLGLRDERWKFIYEIESNRSKLFDLRADPDEKRNLSEEHPERVAAYRQHLLRWCAAQRAAVTEGR